ncbi:GNAT family N-acetyltransferase [Georgenia halophila]|uniref:GNAT family N-acetyltransferase n=1 Tax=Georgenia halophila TaxID=620889 RepID=UPI0031EA9D1C
MGGTSSTAGVLTEDGDVLAVVAGPGANVRSSPGALADQLTEVVATAARRARDRVSGAELETLACVAGVSGAGAAGRGYAVDLIERSVSRAGLRPPSVEVVTDPVVAFAAGSPEPRGSLLLSGTGAVACRFEELAEVERCDGLGWILGDTGSGVWMALEGLRAAAADLDRRGPKTALTAAAAGMTAALGPGTGDSRQDLVRLVDVRSPAELGEFAPVVSGCAAAGDEVALDIVERAVDALLATLAVVDDGGASVVVAGSVLTEGPVRDGVLQALRDRARDAARPVVGALRLAAAKAGWPLPELDRVAPAVAAEPILTVGAWSRDTATAGGSASAGSVGGGPTAGGSGGRHSAGGDWARVASARGASAGGAPAGRGGGPAVDRYLPEDREALYRICLLTGDSGSDATSKYRDGDLLGHIYLGPYLELEPSHARVLRRSDGTPLGYVVTAPNTSAFEEECERSWWPRLRERYPEPPREDTSPDAGLIRTIHHPPRATGPWLDEHPAHLHIDILPEGQGDGNGRRLIEAALDDLTAAGVPGMHLGVGAQNLAAIGFYEHIGLRVLEHKPSALIMGTRLPRS